jgi:hypothetical protein
VNPCPVCGDRREVLRADTYSRVRDDHTRVLWELATVGPCPLCAEVLNRAH